MNARRRTLLSGSAIALVTSLLVMLFALSAGAREGLITAVGTMTSGHVNVAGIYKLSPSRAQVLLTESDGARRLVEETTPGFSYAVQRLPAQVQLYSPAGSAAHGVLVGIEIEEEKELVEFLQLAPESEYVEGSREQTVGDLSGLSRERTIVLFAEQAKRLAVSVGDTVTARTQSTPTNAIDLEVVAVMRDAGMLSKWTLFASRDSLLELYQLSPDSTGVIQIYLDDPAQSDEVMSHLRQTLESAGYELLNHSPKPYLWKFSEVQDQDWVGQRLDLTSWRDEVSYLTWVFDAMDAIFATIALILLGIIAIGIMNAMMMATRERTQEIGTMRAIGMPRWQVLALILIEALLLGFVASSIGAVVGTGFAVVVDAAQIRIPNDALRDVFQTDVIVMHVEAGRVLNAILSLTVFTGVAAIWPAARAAKMQPVTAIHKVD